MRVEQHQRERLARLRGAATARPAPRPPSATVGRMPQPASISSRIGRLVALSSTTRTGRPAQPPPPATAAGGLAAEPQPSRAVKWNVLPRPARSRPRSARPSARPAAARSPGPGRCRRTCRVVEPSACSNGSKIAASLSAGMPMPVSRDREVQQRSHLARRRRAGVRLDATTDDLAALGELDGVADEVDDDLAQPAGSPTRPSGTSGGDAAGQLQPLLRAPAAPAACSASPRRVAQAERDRSRSSLPASIFEKSRMSLMTRQQRLGRRP